MNNNIYMINERMVYTNGYFAYDGCHKIYILEDEEDNKQAMELGFELLPMQKLQEAYDNSCSLVFVNNWKLTTVYVPQFEKMILEVSKHVY